MDWPETITHTAHFTHTHASSMQCVQTGRYIYKSVMSVTGIQSKPFLNFDACISFQRYSQTPDIEKGHTVHAIYGINKSRLSALSV